MKTRTFIFMLFCLFSFTIQAQIDIKGKIRDKALDRLDQKTDEGIDKALDKTEEGVTDAVKETNNENKKEETTEEDSNQNEEGEATQEGKESSKKQEEPKLQSYTKYDFVPGDKVLLFEDFSQDAIGDFPALWTTNGSGEIRTLNNYPGNWLWMNSDGNVYTLMKDLTLPDNFIIEFDMVAAPKDDDPNNSSVELTLYQGEGEFLDNALYPGTGGFHVNVMVRGWWVKGYSYNFDQMPEGETEIAPIDVNKLNHVIIWVQKRRLRIYHKGQKVLDLPTVLYTDVKYNRLRFSLWGQYGLPYITNLRITSAAPDTRSKLLTEGKLVSYGIYFDVNKDVVKPESYGALNDIAKVLNENPAVKVKIVGFTDSDGDDASNLDLSKRRAAAVKNELTKTFKIDASRLETDGKGEGNPIAPNDTPANKAQNRRVEFIKL